MQINQNSNNHQKCHSSIDYEAVPYLVLDMKAKVIVVNDSICRLEANDIDNGGTVYFSRNHTLCRTMSY